MSRFIRVALVFIMVLVTAVALEQHGHVRPARADSAPTVLSGTVVDASGAPVADATVELYPVDLSGASVASVATTTTDAAGSYTLTAPYSGVVQTLGSSNSGYVPFQLEVTSPTLTYESYLSRLWNGTTWVDGSATAPPSKVRLAPNSAGVSPTPATLAAYLAHLLPHRGGVNCSTTHQQVPGTSQVRQTIVGEIHVANDATETYSYGKSDFADSDISVGVSKTRDFGSWTLDGDVHMGKSTSSASSSVATQTRGPNWGGKLRSQFRYAEFHNWKSCGGTTTDQGFSVQAIAWIGGLNNYFGAYPDDHNHNLDGHCPPLGDGRTNDFGQGTYHTNTFEQTSFSHAVGLSVQGVGVTLNSQSGWNSDVSSTWSFGSKLHDHYICGNTRNGPWKSPRIFAGLQS